jgi:hypothetical protein
MLSSIGVTISDGIFGAKKVITEEIAVIPNETSGDAAVGSGSITAGESSVTISNSQVKSASKVFVTFTSAAPSWYVSEKTTGSFTVTLVSPASSDLAFDYLIVGVESSAPGAGNNGNQEPPPPTDTGNTGTTTPDGGDEGTTGGEEETPDTESPTISLNGEASITIQVGDIYTDAGIAAIDAVDTELSYETKVNGEVVSAVNIDTAAAGSYTIIYSATDDAGNTGSIARTVVVEPVVDEVEI